MTIFYCFQEFCKSPEFIAIYEWGEILISQLKKPDTE